MKNNNHPIVKSIVMPFKDYDALIHKVSENKMDVEYNIDGLVYWEGSESEAINLLSEYFGVKVTSVHADDYDCIGVWIAFKDKEED